MSIPVETWRWLATQEGQEAIACAPTEASASVISGLRKRFDADQVRGIMEAGAARRKAGLKLDAGWAATLLADSAGVEMASSSLSSVYKARRFAEVLGQGALVADLCCGIGADSWGLAEAGLRVVGVDADPGRAVMYGHNLPGCSVVCGDALADCPNDAVAFHLDPARRAGAKRTLLIEDFQPGPGVWAAIINRFGDGAIKLNPGVDAYALPAGEVEILSEPHGLTQAVLWVGGLAGDASRRATMLGVDGSVCSIQGEPERPEEAHAIGAVLGTLNACVERADLVGVLLDALGVSLVHPGTGLVTGESTVAHAMVRWYRVLEVLAWSEKRVRAVLRAHGAGVVEVRTRGGVVNPDEVQRKLRGDGDRDDLSVLIYRFGQRVVAVVAEAVREKTPACDGVHAGGDGCCDE
ncbi:MAG: hypothetical protein ACF8MF_05765 [Phycisphaerales bacterium JB052]